MLQTAPFRCDPVLNQALIRGRGRLTGGWVIPHDISFIGHLCEDEIRPFRGAVERRVGSAVLCGALAAARVGARVQAITRMHPDDASMLGSLERAGVDCVLVPAPATTRMVVVHPSADMDEREMRQLESAGPFVIDDLPPLEGRFVHCAGITDQEFTLPFLRALRERGASLSVDLQSFVRQVDPQTREIAFADVPDKAEIVSLMDRVKLDVVEAELLTGTRDLAAAAAAIEGWGCPEILITQAEGVLARVRGETLYERFSNRSQAGRTGRGDTTFAGYMVRRLMETPAEALKFAAALVSMKMESPGPFDGSLEGVLARVEEAHRRP